MKNLKIASVFIFFALLLNACKKTEDEQENINVVKLTVGANVYTWSDLDGTGGTAPKIDTVRMSPSQAADFTVALSDGSVSPAKDYTEEVKSESAAHLFAYTVSGVNLTVSGLSKDGNGKDFGQSGKLTAGTTSTGSLRIVLKHEPDKAAVNPATTGETDVDVTFPVVIR